MTVHAITYGTRRGRFGRVGAGHQGSGRVRSTRRTQDHTPMDLPREMKLQDIRARIEGDRYDVDPHAVAEAIVARLLPGAPGDQCS